MKTVDWAKQRKSFVDGCKNGTFMISEKRQEEILEMFDKAIEHLPKVKAVEEDVLEMWIAKCNSLLNERISGEAEKGSKNEEMIKDVKMICKKCGKRINYEIKDSCPNCGLIIIECKNCKYDYWFGE